MIVETTDNRLYRVEDFPSPDLDHVWRGIPVKRVRGGFVDKANAKPELVRKEGSMILSEAV